MRGIPPSLPDFMLEAELFSQGVSPIAGVDEVGRGPLAGSVCAAAVILDPGNIPQGIGDSKSLSAAARETAFAAIVASARAIGLAFVTAKEIDETDIRKAALKAMRQAVEALSVAPAIALVDGRDLPVLPCPARAVVKGDTLSQSIAAASIIAKVARDAMMRDLARIHGEYGFSTNMGYGCATHLAAIARHGPTSFHRLSFSPCKTRQGDS
ncbi:MAG TPA: ribonuclease HII [Methylocystis sp.]|nr:ribonuclease HII [Methylocystis sp.]